MAAASPPGHDDRRTGRIGRVWLSGVLVAATAAAVFLFSPAASAAASSQSDATTANDYVPTTTIGARSLDVSAFSPECVGNAPYIDYAIKPIGFTSSGPATLTFYDIHGNFIERIVVPTLSGQVVYPGASVDANGKATDWPGWKRAENGNWIPDSSDAHLRDGLTIHVEVDPTATATATVSYPPELSSCFGPPLGIAPIPTTTTPTTTTSICVGPGSTGGGDPTCDPCIPSQPAGGSSATTTGTVDPRCTLPRTGSDGLGTMMTIGAIALAAGAAFALFARRRKGAAAV